MRSYPTRNKNSKKIAKKFKKLENTIIVSFQAKIGWERPRRREKKNRFGGVLADLNRKLKKHCKKIQKIRKHHHSLFSSQNMLRKAEKERK